jgi:hypothetical protein
MNQLQATLSSQHLNTTTLFSQAQPIYLVEPLNQIDQRSYSEASNNPYNKTPKRQSEKSRNNKKQNFARNETVKVNNLEMRLTFSPDTSVAQAVQVKESLKSIPAIYPGLLECLNKFTPIISLNYDPNDSISSYYDQNTGKLHIHEPSIINIFFSVVHSIHHYALDLLSRFLPSNSLTHDTQKQVEALIFKAAIQFLEEGISKEILTYDLENYIKRTKKEHIGQGATLGASNSKLEKYSQDLLEIMKNKQIEISDRLKEQYKKVQETAFTNQEAISADPESAMLHMTDHLELYTGNRLTDELHQRFATRLKSTLLKVIPLFGEYYDNIFRSCNNPESINTTQLEYAQRHINSTFQNLITSINASTTQNSYGRILAPLIGGVLLVGCIMIAGKVMWSNRSFLNRRLQKISNKQYKKICDIEEGGLTDAVQMPYSSLSQEDVASITQIQGNLEKEVCLLNRAISLDESIFIKKRKLNKLIEKCENYYKSSSEQVQEKLRAIIFDLSEVRYQTDLERSDLSSEGYIEFLDQMDSLLSDKLSYYHQEINIIERDITGNLYERPRGKEDLESENSSLNLLFDANNEEGCSVLSKDYEKRGRDFSKVEDKTQLESRDATDQKNKENDIINR